MQRNSLSELGLSFHSLLSVLAGECCDNYMIEEGGYEDRCFWMHCSSQLISGQIPPSTGKEGPLLKIPSRKAASEQTAVDAALRQGRLDIVWKGNRNYSSWKHKTTSSEMAVTIYFVR
jgi:hypothetical protein